MHSAADRQTAGQTDDMIMPIADLTVQCAAVRSAKMQERFLRYSMNSATSDRLFCVQSLYFHWRGISWLLAGN